MWMSSGGFSGIGQSPAAKRICFLSLARSRSQVSRSGYVAGVNSVSVCGRFCHRGSMGSPVCSPLPVSGEGAGGGVSITPLQSPQARRIFFQACGVEFFPAVIGVDAVLFLFDVGELRVAIPRDVGVVEEYGCEFFDAVIHVFDVGGAFAIAPTAFAVCGLFCFDGIGVPPCAAVFIHDIGLALIGRAHFGKADGCVFPVVGDTGA